MQASDAELLSRFVQERDADCFTELVSRHRTMVYSTAVRRVGSAAVAEEITQECFARLARRSAGVKRSVAGWLHRTAVNASIDAIRRDESRRNREKEAVFLAANESNDASWGDVKEELDQAIDRLPARLREPVVMHFLEGHRQEDVADSLGLSQSAVSRRLKKGIEGLRHDLGKSGVPVSAMCLVALFSVNALEAAPVDATLATRALASAKAAGTGGVTARLSAWGTRLATLPWYGKTAAVCAVLLAVGVGLHLAAGNTSPHDLASWQGVFIDFSSEPTEESGIRWPRWGPETRLEITLMEGRRCCILRKAGKTSSLYLDVDDAYFHADQGALRVEVDYLDRGTTKFGLQYDSRAEGLDAFRKLARFVRRTDSGTWKTAVFLLNDPRCETRYADADIVVRAYHESPAGDLHISAIRVTRAAIALIPASDCLAADGISKCDVEVVGRDAHGAFLPDDTEVVLAATKGVITPSAVRLKGGKAVAQFRSVAEPGTVRISATAGGMAGEVMVHLLAGSGAIIDVEYEVDDLSDLSDCTASGVGATSWSVAEYTPEQGPRCARIDYAFPARSPGQYQLVELRIPRLLTGKPEGVTLWLYNNGGGGDIDDVGICDAEGEVYQIQLSWENPVETWSRIEAAIDAATGSWFESGNGWLDYPLTFGFLKVHPSHGPSKGYVLVRDLRVRGKTPESETIASKVALSPAPDFFVGVGDKVRLGCLVTNIATTVPRQVELSWDVAAPDGGRVAGAGESVTFEAGQTLARTADFVPEQAGDYVVSVHAKGGAVKHTQTFTVPVVRANSGDAAWHVEVGTNGVIGPVTVNGAVGMAGLGLVLAAPRWADPRLFEQHRLKEGALTRSETADTQRLAGVVTLTNGDRLHLEQTLTVTEDALILSYVLTPEKDIQTEAVLLAGYIPIDVIGCPWYRVALEVRERHTFPRHQMGNQLLCMDGRPERLGWFTRSGAGLEVCGPASGFAWWQLQDSRRFGLDQNSPLRTNGTPTQAFHGMVAFRPCPCPCPCPNGAPAPVELKG